MMLLRPTAFSTGGLARSLILTSWLIEFFFLKFLYELDWLPQLRGSVVLTCVPPRASSHVSCDGRPMRAWRPPASEGASELDHS